jgi:hypothetical protein
VEVTPLISKKEEIKMIELTFEERMRIAFQELIPVIPVLPELERILTKSQWDKDVFVQALNLGNVIISKSKEDSYRRFLLHQRYNRAMSELRAERLGDEAEVVLGFFRLGEAEETSLFTGDTEQARELFGGALPLYRTVIIGYGCRDLSIPVTADFDTSVDHDWGWSDDVGTHVENYLAESRIFFRSSMSGRTHYALRIDEENVATPMPCL